MMHFQFNLFPQLDLPCQAAKHIPEYEPWIVARNVSKIKSVLLAKEQHNNVCASMESQIAALGSLEAMFGEFSNMNIFPAHAVAKLRTVQGHVKQIRTYNVSVHAIHLIINTMPAKQSREKAAILRELLFAKWGGGHGDLKRLAQVVANTHTHTQKHHLGVTHGPKVYDCSAVSIPCVSVYPFRSLENKLIPGSAIIKICECECVFSDFGATMVHKQCLQRMAIF